MKEMARWQLLRRDENGSLRLVESFKADKDVTDFVNEHYGTDTKDLVVKSMVTERTYRYEEELR